MTNDWIATRDVLSTIFDSLGRTLICLDGRFRIVIASDSLRELVGETIAAKMLGRPIAQYLGHDLFAEGGSIRRALLDGERREDWRGSLPAEGGPRIVSISVAPLRGHTAFHKTVKYVVVLRPVQQEAYTAGPTARPDIEAEPKSEADRIRAVLHSTQWRRDRAAAHLQMSRTTLWRKMRAYGLLQRASN